MRILVACEESQAVTIALRANGHEAYSCDIVPCSGGHPEWHIQQDAREILGGGWEMMIAFPPCTHLAVSGARWFEQKRADGRQAKGVELFMSFANAPIEKIAIENPVGIMSSVWRKPDQVIQPYLFGDEYTKTTCLWLKNLPRLVATNIVGKGNRTTFKSGKSHPTWYAEAIKLPPAQRSAARSKTFPGIAAAMADQWAGRAA